MKRAAIQLEIDRLVEAYCSRVLALRTRVVRLPGRKCRSQILFTFLGYELKAGRRRLTCPDLETARYLRVFAELGMSEVRIPYDPTQTADLLPVLEDGFARLNRCLEEDDRPRVNRLAAQRRVYAKIRRALAACSDAAARA